MTDKKDPGGSACAGRCRLGRGHGTGGRLHWKKGGQEKMWGVGAEGGEGEGDRII